MLVTLGIPASAHAQRAAEDIASARELYNEGIDLRDKGDLKGAVEKFRAAHALGNTPITGLDLCRTYSALHQPVEAREACLSVARIDPIKNESERSKGARSDAASLAEAEKAKIAGLRIRVIGSPAGVEPTVVVDGVTVPAAALSASRAVNPGKHVVVASASGGPETNASVELRDGEIRDVELVVRPGEANRDAAQATAPTSPTPGAPPPKKKSHALATASFIVAGVSGLVGVITGISAMNSESDLDPKCPNKICGRSDWRDLDSARTTGTVSTVAFVVAGVGLGVGLVSILASGSSKASASTKSSPATSIRVQPVFGLGGGGVYGTF